MHSLINDVLAPPPGRGGGAPSIAGGAPAVRATTATTATAVTSCGKSCEVFSFGVVARRGGAEHDEGDEGDVQMQRVELTTVRTDLLGMDVRWVARVCESDLAQINTGAHFHDVGAFEARSVRRRAARLMLDREDSVDDDSVATAWRPRGDRVAQTELAAAEPRSSHYYRAPRPSVAPSVRDDVAHTELLGL